MKRYDNSYFMDEVRDGFFVPSMMKKAWAVNMMNYKELEEYCKSRGLKVFGTWGSLLGAVRHGGFIPWDDDIDVAMIRNEYDVLKAAGDEGKLPGEHQISDYEFNDNDNLTRGWLDSKYLVRLPEDIVTHYGFPLINIIDIFILDYVPRDEDERELYVNLIQLAVSLKFASQEWDKQKKMSAEELASVPDDERVKKSELMKGLIALEKYLNIKFDLSGEKPMYMQLLQAIEDLSGSYGIDKCDELAMMSYYLDNIGRIVPRELYEDTIDMDYEGDTISMPIGYDGILRRYWPGFMHPVIDFGGHGYPYYRYMEEDVVKYANMEFLYYHFFEDKYKETVSAKQTRIPVSDAISGSIELFEDAHFLIISKLKSGIIDDEVFEVLGNCQDLAVTIGNSIEERVVDGGDIVSLLEQYCEYVYSLYQRCGSAGETLDSPHVHGSEEKLKEYERRFEKEIKQAVTEKQEIRDVVFITYRTEHWKSLHTIWEAAKEAEIADPSVRVIVIAVPYYFKNSDGTWDKENPILEEGYPPEIEITPYDAYDFEMSHPKAIIYTCPYDEYNEAMCIHPYYYAANLQKYTDNMVLIPPFKLREVSTTGERLEKTLGEYLCKPGAIYADHIYAQSDEMRETFIRLLDEFVTKEEGQSIIDFDKKIIASGSACDDWESRQDDTKQVPDEWIGRIKSESGKYKKIVLFYISGSMLFEHGVSEVDRASSTLEKLKKYDDAVIVWHVDKYARQILKKYNPSAWNAFRKLREEYASDDKVIIDETWDMERAAKIADVYIGDASIAMNMCRIDRKPVLWLTPGVWEESADMVNGCPKEWTEDMLIATEGTDDGLWSIEEFMNTATKYHKEVIRTEYGKEIWRSIHES